MMRRETKTLPIECVELKLGDSDSERTFEGYASTFNGVDSYGDTVLPGAYTETIKNRRQPIAMRWNHLGPIIGKWTEIAEDGTGLRVKGSLTPGHSVAEDVYASLKHGAVGGLSIGYRIPDGGAQKAGKIRQLKRVDLIEVSVVESPADANARVDSIKGLLDEIESLADCEAVLRDAAGLSRADAVALVSRIKAIALGDRGRENDDVAAVAALIRAVRIPGA